MSGIILNASGYIPAACGGSFIMGSGYIPINYDNSGYYTENTGDYDLGNPDKLDVKYCKKCGATVYTQKVCCPYCEEYYFDR